MNRLIDLMWVALIAIPPPGGALWAGESPPFGSGDPAPEPPSFEVCRAVVRISGSARPGLGGPLKVKIYLSDIMPRGPINDEDIRGAFEKHLVGTYGQEYPAVECSYAYTREDAQKILDVGYREGYENQTFLETGWKYAPPATAAAPAPEQYAVCWANRNAKVKYYSAVFDGSRDDAGKWWPAFQGYLKQQYGLDEPTQCIPARTRADAESYLGNLIDQDRKLLTMQGKAPEIVETGWKY